MRSERCDGLCGGMVLIEINEALVLLVAVLAWIVFRILSWRKTGPVSTGHELLINVFFVYLLFVFHLTLFPMYIIPGGISPSRANFDPFLTTQNMLRYLSPYTLTQILGNLILLAPLGIFLPLLAPATRTWWRILGIGFLITLVIEICQYFLAVRVFDIDDLILNTLGAGLGYAIYGLASRIARRINFHESWGK